MPKRRQVTTKLRCVTSQKSEDFIYNIDNTGGADKSLAQPGRKRDTEAEDFEFHISYL